VTLQDDPRTRLILFRTPSRHSEGWRHFLHEEGRILACNKPERI
jgi:hypothetical protein